MQIIKGFPPNYKQIKEKFNPPEEVVFTYGENIYSPKGFSLDNSVIIHEATHCGQQGKDPEGWWKKYIDDPEFRKTQELEAYRIQYEFIKNRYKDRNQRARILHKLAVDFSSSTYGNIIDYQDAVKGIKNEDKKV